MSSPTSPTSPPQPSRVQSAPPPTLTVEDMTAEEPSARTVNPDSFVLSHPHTAPSANEWQHGNLRHSTRGTWHKTHRRKNLLQWKGDLTSGKCSAGRVLLIDYISQDASPSPRRKILAQEFYHLSSLRAFYADPVLAKQAALRVIHVQNAPWATHYLLRKFNIDHRDEVIGTSFGRWARFAKPQRRAGKPLLNGKTFRTQRDPWRGISRAAFGLDYLKQYPVGHGPRDQDMKFMELNAYDAEESPRYEFDVHVQRLSVYVQLKEEEEFMPMRADADFGEESPYGAEAEMSKLKKQWEESGGGQEDFYVPNLKTLDNSSTVIVFEQSVSGEVTDTLIQPRHEIESRWRRLPFYFGREGPETDQQLAIMCMDLILKDVFKGLGYAWEKYLNCCETHISILEDKIYENPADESRAPELWTNSSLWLKVEKLIFIHIDIVKEMKNHLKEMADDEPEWLENTEAEYEKLENLVQEDLVKPTTSLSDLMYKSVEIRDSRQSLQLGNSMWRLSWITFIFLPLTFLVGFFGMNVNTFEDNPSIKWYFISSIPFMLLVMLIWFLLKNALAKSRSDPLRRGVYENLYLDLSARHPSVWTRSGPRRHFNPKGWWPRLKWSLLSHWFAPDRTIRTTTTGQHDAAVADLGVWSQTKYYLLRRWLPGLESAPRASVAAQMDADADLGLLESGTAGAVQELLTLSQPVAMADGNPRAAQTMRPKSPGSGSGSGERGSSERGRRRASSPLEETERPGSQHSSLSGAMVEEKGSSDGESGSEGAAFHRGGGTGNLERGRRERGSERLGVPVGGGSLRRGEAMERTVTE